MHDLLLDRKRRYLIGMENFTLIPFIIPGIFIERGNAQRITLFNF